MIPTSNLRASSSSRSGRPTSLVSGFTHQKPLSPEAEAEAIRAFKAGDKRAGRRLIESCLPFVSTIALEYRRWGVPLEDIVQEGLIGLLKAAMRFDETRQCRLVTYAAYWIRAEIRDFVVRAYRVVRIGASKPERRALRYYRKNQERDPVELARVSGLTEEKAERLLPLLIARDTSLDDRDEDRASLAERMSAAGPSPEVALIEADADKRESVALRAAIEVLPPRERTIVERRYLDEQPMTLEQVGVEFGISKERVRQLEERAKGRMREFIQSHRDAA